MPPAIPRIDGPLGNLAGMYFDPSRNRYFPIPKDPPPSDQTSTLPHSSPVQSSSRLPAEYLPPTGCDIRWNKKAKLSHSASEAPPRSKTGRLVFRGRRDRDGDRSLRKHYSELELQNTFSCGGCHGEQITSIKSFAGGAFYVTTDHGKVVIHRQDGETHGIGVCASGLVGMHTDIPRMTMMAIAGGPEAHVHHFRRDPENLDYVFMQHSELDLPQGDIYSMGSFDDRCVLGGSKSLTTVSYTSGIRSSRRTLQSDVLAVHQNDPNLVYAGLRNGSVALEDLRVTSRQINRVGGTVKQKAVVGVRRLSDSAVPWGLIVSGLSDELLIYDIRFSSAPLYSCVGHINKYHDRLGLTTTPDDKFIYAAGSDNRLRLFDTRSGHRVMPDLVAEEDSLHQRRIGPSEDNPLKRIFQDKVENITVREDNLGVDLSVKGDLMRFGAVDYGDPIAYDGLMSLD